MENGEFVSKEFTINVAKVYIDAYAEGYKAGGEILYYVDNVQNTLLPLGSCESFETVKHTYYRSMIYPFYNDSDMEMFTLTHTIRPNEVLEGSFSFYGPEEVEGEFRCICHGDVYKYAREEVEFIVNKPTEFFQFNFHYE